jgi:hypothetical protein
MSNWVKYRKPLRDYPKTQHQKKIGTAGKVVAKVCKGKKKLEFRACRHEVMECIIHGKECPIEIADAVREVENKS